MQATKLRPGTRRGGVIWLPVDELEPSPVQPRKTFPTESFRSSPRA